MLNTALDIARGFAALWVFVYHMRMGIQPGPLRQFADVGFLGVPAFFVISGYCMMASSRGIMRKGQSSGFFLKRRLLRIYPPFWASVLVAMAIPLGAAAYHGAMGLGYKVPEPGWFHYKFGDWAALAALARGLFWNGPAHKPYSAINSVYWTLAIEVQFYLVMYLALVFRKAFHGFLLGVTAACLAAWAWVGPFAPGFFAEYWPMFALGLLLHWVLQKGARPAALLGAWTRNASIAGTTAVAAATIAAVMIAPARTLLEQTLFAAACAAAFWFASGIGEPSVSAPPLRFLTGLGKMSYSVYLLHIPVVSLVGAWVRMGFPRYPRLSLLLSIAATLPVTYAFYHFCEKPCIPGRAAPSKACALEGSRSSV